MHERAKYLQFYLGCHTNKGQFVGFDNNALSIKSKHMSNRIQYPIQKVGEDVFLYLRRLSDLTLEESGTLIQKGMNIGRPQGYSFSPDAFIFLLDLYVDLFALIDSGLAKDIRSISPDKYEK